MTKNSYERQAREAERVARYFDCDSLPSAENVTYVGLPGMAEARCLVNTGCGEVAALRTDGSVLVNCLDETSSCSHFHHQNHSHNNNHLRAPLWVAGYESSSSSAASFTGALTDSQESSHNGSREIFQNVFRESSDDSSEDGHDEGSHARHQHQADTQNTGPRIHRAPVRNVTCMTTVGSGVVVLGGDDGMVASLDVVTGSIYCAARVYQPHPNARARELAREREREFVGFGGSWHDGFGVRAGIRGIGSGGRGGGSARSRHVRALSVDPSCIPGGLIYLAAGADVCALTHSGGRNIRCAKRVRSAHGGVVAIMDVVAGGGVVLTAGRDATVTVWDSSLRRRARLQHSNNIDCMAATKGAIVTACNGTVRIYTNSISNGNNTASGNATTAGTSTAFVPAFQLRAEVHGLSPRGSIAALMPSYDGRSLLIVPRRGHWAFVSCVTEAGETENAAETTETKVVRRVQRSPGFRCHAATPGPHGRILVADSLGCYIADIDERRNRARKQVQITRKQMIAEKLKPYRTHTAVILITASIALAALAMRRNVWRIVP